MTEGSAIAEDSQIAERLAEDSNILRSIATYIAEDSGIEKDSAFAESSHFF
jgi:hypothetical protein